MFLKSRVKANNFSYPPKCLCSHPDYFGASRTCFGALALAEGTLGTSPPEADQPLAENSRHFRHFFPSAGGKVFNIGMRQKHRPGIFVHKIIVGA